MGVSLSTSALTVASTMSYSDNEDTSPADFDAEQYSRFPQPPSSKEFVVDDFSEQLQDANLSGFVVVEVAGKTI